MIAIISYLSNTGAGGYFDMFDWRASTDKLVSGGYLNYLETTIYADKIGSAPYGIQEFFFAWGSINVVPIRKLEIFTTLKGMNWLPDTAISPQRRWFGGVRDFDFGFKYQFVERRSWGISFLLNGTIATGERQSTYLCVPPDCSIYQDSIKVREGLHGARVGLAGGYDFVRELWSLRLLLNGALGFGYNVDSRSFGLTSTPLFLGFGLFTSYYDLESGVEIKYYGPISFNPDFIFFTPMVRYKFFNGGIAFSAGTNLTWNYYTNRYYLTPKDPKKWEWNWELLVGMHVSPARIAERKIYQPFPVGMIGGPGMAVLVPQGEAKSATLLVIVDSLGKPISGEDIKVQEEAKSAILLVIVVDSLTGKPISGADIKVVGKISKEAKTDQVGTYRDDSLPRSNYLLSISKSDEGYQPVDVGVALQTDAVVKVKLAKKLSRKPQLVATAYYDTDKTIIKSQYQRDLDKVGQMLVEEPYAKVVIRGHADRRGGAFYNELLSRKRAAAVKEYLMRQFDLSEDRFIIENYTIFEPTGKGLASDRRVEVYILLPEGKENK
ncbi:MAG: OmpA family protein [Candidatus Caldipriscus sp.]